MMYEATPRVMGFPDFFLTSDGNITRAFVKCVLARRIIT